MPLLHRREFRRACYDDDPTAVVAALTGVEFSAALQQVGAGTLTVHHRNKGREQESLTPVMVSVLQRLRERGWTGDDLLAEDLLAVVQGRDPEGRWLPVDLDMLASEITGSGCYVNRDSGEVVPAFVGDERVLDEDPVIDLDDEAWLFLEEGGSRDGWTDMADFVASLDDLAARDRLAEAIHGRGAFSRFRRAVDELDLGEEWHCFSDDRRWGRAREALAAHGIRPC